MEILRELFTAARTEAVIPLEGLPAVRAVACIGCGGMGERFLPVIPGVQRVALLLAGDDVISGKTIFAGGIVEVVPRLGKSQADKEDAKQREKDGGAHLHGHDGPDNAEQRCKQAETAPIIEGPRPGLMLFIFMPPFPVQCFGELIVKQGRQTSGPGCSPIIFIIL